MSDKITRQKFEKMHGSEKTQVYFNANLVPGKNKSSGPSLISQAYWWNNHERAFRDFAESLNDH